MEIIINHGILHIIDNERSQVVLSETELDLDSDMVTEFLTKHIKKLLSSTAAKEATFSADSQTYADISKFISMEIDFKEVSRGLCQSLSAIMLENVSIPAADILIAQFDIDHRPHLAVFKLNHSVFYTHEVKNGENHIVKSTTALPFAGGKVTEAAIIGYDPPIIKLMEKPHSINGEETNYFSEIFLGAGCEMSKKEAAKLIKDILKDITDEHCGGDPLIAGKFQLALIEEALENDGDVRLENVVRHAFGEEPYGKEFLNAAREAGLGQDIFFGEKFAQKEFASVKIKSENGIELKFPIGLLDDTNIIQFEQRTEIQNGNYIINIKDMWKS